MSEFEFEGYSPSKASEVIARELGFNEDEKKQVMHDLDNTEEDPILVIHLNQRWVEVFGLDLANQVLDSIATFQTNNNNPRRDQQARRICFHFAQGFHINQCRAFLLAHPNPLFRNAFAPGPEILELWANYQGNREPMGTCVQVNKVMTLRSDVQIIPFFYLY